MKRIQRKRTKGFRLPENTICVNRPTKWGNPLRLDGDMIMIHAGYRRANLAPWVFYTLGDIDDVLHLYDLILDGIQFVNKDLQYWSDQFKKNDIEELRGKNVACFCRLDQKCHADVLLKKLNQ